jgi:hypothetical protein
MGLVYTGAEVEVGIDVTDSPLFEEPNIRSTRFRAIEVPTPKENPSFTVCIKDGFEL